MTFNNTYSVHTQDLKLSCSYKKNTLLSDFRALCSLKQLHSLDLRTRYAPSQLPDNAGLVNVLASCPLRNLKLSWLPNKEQLR